MCWNHGPPWEPPWRLPQESQYSRSALGTTTSHQQVLPENAAAPRICFLRPVIFFAIIWQSSSCSPWLHRNCPCRFLWASWLLWRKDVMKRGGWGLYPSPTESRPSIWKIQLHLRRELGWRWGTWLSAGSPGPQCQGYFCLLTDSCSGPNGDTVLTVGPKTQLLLCIPPQVMRKATPELARPKGCCDS